MRTPTLLNKASGQTGSSSTPPGPPPARKMSAPQRKGLPELTSGPCCALLPQFQPPSYPSPCDEAIGGLKDRNHVQTGAERSECHFSQLPNQTSGSDACDSSKPLHNQRSSNKALYAMHHWIVQTVSRGKCCSLSLLASTSLLLPGSSVSQHASHFARPLGKGGV